MHKTNLKLLFLSLSSTSCARQRGELSFAFASFFIMKNRKNLLFISLANCIRLSHALDAVLSLPVLDFFPFPSRARDALWALFMQHYLINIIFASLYVLPVFFSLFHRTHHSTSARFFALCRVRFLFTIERFTFF